MPSDCLFCKVVKNEIPNYTVYEDNDFLAFLDISPQSAGHTLVIPKRHSTVIAGMTDEETNRLLPVVKLVKDKIEKTLNPDGFNIGWNDGKAAGQVVPHLHIHIIPRWEGDGGLGLHGSVNNPGDTGVEGIAELLKK